MIGSLAKLHEQGYVHNDLKLENILVGDQHSTPASMHEIRIIDFGLVTDYLDADGNHVEET